MWFSQIIDISNSSIIFKEGIWIRIRIRNEVCEGIIVQNHNNELRDIAQNYRQRSTFLSSELSNLKAKLVNDKDQSKSYPFKTYTYSTTNHIFFILEKSLPSNYQKYSPPHHNTISTEDTFLYYYSDVDYSLQCAKVLDTEPLVVKLLTDKIPLDFSFLFNSNGDIIATPKKLMPRIGPNVWSCNEISFQEKELAMMTREFSELELSDKH